MVHVTITLNSGETHEFDAVEPADTTNPGIVVVNGQAFADVANVHYVTEEIEESVARQRKFWRWY